MGEIQVLDISSYPDYTKSLISNLQSPEDQNLANAWLNRLIEDTTATEELKLNYFKLLTYFLQMLRLDGPFKDDPTTIEILTELPEDQNIFENKNIIKKKKRFTPEFFGKIKAKSNTLKENRAEKVAQMAKKGKTLDKNTKFSAENNEAGSSRIKEFFSKTQQKIRYGFRWITFRLDTPPDL